MGTTRFRSASSGPGPTCRPLEDWEPVLHTGEGPLAFRKTGIPADEAKALVNELL